MTIEKTANEIIFRVPKTANIDELQDLMDYLQHYELTQSFTANQQEIDELVKTIKKGRWTKTKAKI